MGVQVKKMEARQVTEGSDRVTCRAPSWFEIYRTWSRDTISDHVRSLETVWYTFATFQVHYNRCLPINPPPSSTHTPIPLETTSLIFYSILFLKNYVSSFDQIYHIRAKIKNFLTISLKKIMISRAYHAGFRFLVTLNWHCIWFGCISSWQSSSSSVA